MERYIMNKILEWKNSRSRKPLIIMGARQVGKTWVMKEFGKRFFKNTVYINFDNADVLKGLFEKDYDINRILMELSIYSSIRINSEDTLIIFDEIQENKKAITALKYFCEDAPEYAIIAAGSLLGVSIHEGISFPVGKVKLLNIYPLSFREFMLALGKDMWVEQIDNGNYEALNSVRDNIVDMLKHYYYVGGMPEVVNNFIENRDFIEIRDLQKDIISLYEKDFGKHTPNEELPRLSMVWNSIPTQLAKENKKFFFGHIKKGARSKDYELAIEWLLNCGLIYKVYNVTKPYIPLKSYVDFSAFKLYCLDVGLLGAMSDLSVKTILEGNKIFTEFKGALTEQYVLQELISETPFKPYYFTETKSEGEIDFLIQKDEKVIPIEVKAEENLRAKSLRLFSEKYNPKYAIRTSMSNYRKEEWLVNIPLWAVWTV